ncbi:MAG: plasmid mobilization protein [Angelakisella sp.]
MKEEKVRIKVRLTEEEKEKLERNSALCGLTQSEYVRQLCRGIHPKPQPPDVFWELMDELYKVSFRPERMCQIRAVRP